MFVTEEQAKEQKEAEARERAHADALSREIGDACKGALDEVRARRAEFEAEQRAIVNEQLPVARVRAERSPEQFQPEVDRLNRRLRDLREIIGAMGRQVANLLEAAREERARKWRASPETRRLYAEYVAGEARSLEHVAAIAEEWDAVTRIGGAGGPPVPIDRLGLPMPPRMEQLRVFEAFVATLRRCGMHVDTAKLPPAIRTRLERTQ